MSGRKWGKEHLVVGAALAQDPRAWVPFGKSLSGTNWDLPSGPISLFVN